MQWCSSQQNPNSATSHTRVPQLHCSHAPSPSYCYTDAHSPALPPPSARLGLARPADRGAGAPPRRTPPPWGRRGLGAPPAPPRNKDARRGGAPPPRPPGRHASLQRQVDGTPPRPAPPGGEAGRGPSHPGRPEERGAARHDTAQPVQHHLFTTHLLPQLTPATGRRTVPRCARNRHVSFLI